MRTPLTIAAAQPPCISYDVSANARAHADAVRAAGTRVVVFPEMSLTGYVLDASTVSPNDARLASLVEACAEKGSLALAGAPVEGAGGSAHIALLAIDGSGVRVAYRKLWLGGAEARRFSPGSEPSVIEVDGWRLGLAICKDTGIPQHAVDTAAQGMDVYVAAVLEFAEDTAVPEQRARRIAAAHGVWVAISSFAGSTGEGYDRAAGGSGIWSPQGAAISRVGPEVGAVAAAVIG